MSGEGDFSILVRPKWRRKASFPYFSKISVPAIFNDKTGNWVLAALSTKGHSPKNHKEK
jgi:hypothetical protein